MDKNFSRLEPKAVWKHFLNICAIPHPSYHEEAIAAYVVDFAKANNIEHTMDEAGNVVLRKHATKGMEGAKGVVMQAHFDMVPQKNGDKVFDFEKDPIEAYIDGDWVTANGTTLGSDNGMGMAAILAVFEDNTLVHGAIEGLFTRTEETGMNGAFNLKSGILTGDILLNLDSEREGELCVGCAGGLDASMTFKYNETAPQAGLKAVKIEIKGLKGGHSGIEIVLQRANANKLLTRFVREQSNQYDIQLASIDGGGLRNAIPREATAIVLLDEANIAKIIANAAEFQATVKAEFEGVEEGIYVSASECATPAKAIEKKVGDNLIAAVFSAPNGVIKMSTAMHGLVETSTNLARVVSKDGEIFVQCLLRSTSRSEKFELGEMIRCVFELAGAKAELTGAYDGWNPNMRSAILKTMTESYKALFGKEPEVGAIHAGLECGIIGGVYPNLDMISFGPTICYPHSPDEKVNIASVEKFWRYLCHTLANAPKK